MASAINLNKGGWRTHILKTPPYCVAYRYRTFCNEEWNFVSLHRYITFYQVLIKRCLNLLCADWGYRASEVSLCKVANCWARVPKWGTDTPVSFCTFTESDVHSIMPSKTRSAVDCTEGTKAPICRTITTKTLRKEIIIIPWDGATVQERLQADRHHLLWRERGRGLWRVGGRESAHATQFIQVNQSRIHHIHTFVL